MHGADGIHSFCATPFITTIYHTSNRAQIGRQGRSLIDQAGARLLWVDTRTNLRNPSSSMGGPFPLIALNLQAKPREAQRTYTAWVAGELSVNRTPWEINSEASADPTSTQSLR